MTASVANEVSALEKADRIVKHLKNRKEGKDVLLFCISIGAGYEDTRGDIEGNEWRDIMGGCGGYNWNKCAEYEEVEREV